MPRGDGNILIDGAEIAFRNFAGKEGEYNRAGDRNFCVMLDAELARTLEEDGWNIKQLRVREEGDTPQKYIQVSIKYRGRDGNLVRPPDVWLLTSKGRTKMDEDSVEVLDFYDIANVDLIIRPYEWRVSGKSGIKAYLKTLYFRVAEDALALRYADVPEIGVDDQLAIESGSQDVIDSDGWYDDDDQRAIER